MKKVFLLNFPNDDDSFFGDELHQELEKLGVPTYRGDVVDFLLDLGNGKGIAPKLIRGEELVEPKEALFFLKKRQKHNRFFSSLLSQFVGLFGGYQLNELYKQHHKNISKFSQAITLIKNGYRIPRTLLVYGKKYSDYRKYIEQQLAYPFVLKASGSGGNSVWKIDNFDDISSLVSDLSDDRAEVLAFQEYIETSREEFRVVFFEGEVVSLVRRSSEDFYNNAAQGGHVSVADVSENEIAVCKNIARISGLSYLAVDFMRLENGESVFMEVQTGPSMTVSKTANPETVRQIAVTLKAIAGSSL